MILSLPHSLNCFFLLPSGKLLGHWTLMSCQSVQEKTGKQRWEGEGGPEYSRIKDGEVGSGKSEQELRN